MAPRRVFVGVALGLAVLLALIPGWSCWLLAPLLALFVYMLGGSLKLTFVSRRGRERNAAI